MVAEILNLPFQQAVTWLAMSEPVTFEQTIHTLLDQVTAPDTVLDQALQAVMLTKTVGRRIALNPYLALRVVNCLLDLGDAEPAAEIGALALQDNHEDPQVTSALASATLRALLATGADNQDRLRVVGKARQLPAPAPVTRHAGAIRVGFVSANFPSSRDHWHPTDVVRQLSHPDFQIYVYAVGPQQVDDVGLAARVGVPAEQARAVGGRAVDDIIEIIRADAIDILIDLDHSFDPILQAIFWAKPAQATVLWQIGPVAFGCQPYDFIVASEEVIPKGNWLLYRERILPQPSRFYAAGQSVVLPAMPEPGETVNFAVLCRPEYISQTCLLSWAALLMALPTTQLVLVLPKPHGQVSAANLLKRMAEVGVPVDRVITRFAADDVMADMAGVDIVLDSFPANDPDACYRALLAGLPVVTVTGASPSGRSSACLLEQIGMSALVMADATSYVELAAALACQDRAERAAFRQLVQGGVAEKLSYSMDSFVAQLQTNLRNVYMLLTQIEDVTPEDAVRYLTDCGDDIFELALHRLMMEYLSTDDNKRKIRALKIASSVPERLAQYPIQTLNIISALVSVSDFETSGNIGYLAYSATSSEIVRRNLRHSTLFSLSAGTDVDSRRVNELALAKGRLELLPQLRPRWRPRPAAGRRIRVGYVFSFFNHDAYQVHTRPVFEMYDRDGFDVFAYGMGDRDVNPEALSARVNLPLDRVRALGGLDDDAAANIIRQDNIDILVELDGFSNIRRDGVFLRRPAAINVLWYNTPYTLGIDLYDFVIADPIVLPPEERAVYSEEIVDMPHSVYSWMTQGELPPVADAPCGQNGYITFGSFNRMDKLSMLCLESWAEILRRVPTARLLLHYPSLRYEDIRLWQTDRMQRAGLPMDRVRLRVGGPEFANWQTFMASYGEVDIGLDPYPYCGGHTTYDTVCMGVPLVCFPGPRYPSRISVSIVTACDLPDLVAPDRDGYIDMAVRLAQETPAQLTARRHDIRRRVLGSPFRQWPEFVGALEGHYRSMVDRAQAWPERQ